MGAFAKNAPIPHHRGELDRIARALLVCARASADENHWRRKEGATIAYSTTGASTHISVLRFISDHGLKAKPVATGDISATTTQAMSGQVDVGWSVAPFNLDPLSKGEIRLVARASDIERIRGQTIRVQITNLATLEQKKDAIERYLAAYRETVEWMYASADAVARYVAFSKRRRARCGACWPSSSRRRACRSTGSPAHGEHQDAVPVQVSHCPA